MSLGANFASRPGYLAFALASACLCALPLPSRGAPTAAASASLQETLAKGVSPGTTVPVDDAAGPVVADMSVANLRGEPGKPVVIRGVGEGRAVIRGRLRLTGAAYVVLERLAFEPDVADGADKAWVDIAGEHIELRDCSIRGAPGDGLRLVGANNAVEGGEVYACEGYGLVLDGSARVHAVRIAACRHGGLRVGGQALIGNCLLLHNRGPALEANSDADVRFFHNLVYDNGGGLILDAGRNARVINNLLI
ncbi:MAG: right-handed parallel beta-helix repeat-containing protein, partial [Planctomycetota bacterium]